jgi:hypothetical protein
MAAAVAATELLIPAAIYLALRGRGLDPLFPRPARPAAGCPIVPEERPL